MTGFAQSEGQDNGLSWRLELKSVNSKGFDLRCRMPGGFEAFDSFCRSAIAQPIKRGSLSLSLNLEAASEAKGARLNRALLDDVIKVAKEISTENIQLEHLLAVRGVIETEDTQLELTPALQSALEKALHTTLAKLVSARADEGQHLLNILTSHLDQIEQLTQQARAEASTQPQILRDKMMAKLAELLGSQPALSPERLAQETALLASRVDVTEEINRLLGHVSNMRKLLADGGAIGRKLDFMCQELNREANTLCSKSESLQLTNIGVELKVTIEQLREQVQNVE